MIVEASHSEALAPSKGNSTAAATEAAADGVVDRQSCGCDGFSAASSSTRDANSGHGDSSGSTLPALRSRPGHSRVVNKRAKVVESNAVAQNRDIVVNLTGHGAKTVNLSSRSGCHVVESAEGQSRQRFTEALEQQPEEALEVKTHNVPPVICAFKNITKKDGVPEPLLQHISSCDVAADEVECPTHLRSSKSSIAGASNSVCVSGCEATHVPGCGAAVEDATPEWEAMLEEGIPAFAAAHRDIFLSRLRRGIPARCRWRAWKVFLGVEALAEPGLFERLLLQDSRWRPLILVDAPRTFPSTTVFDEGYQRVLVRILHAYSVLRPEVGYCQGMNFIAGLLLLVSQCQEEESFFVLCALMDERRLSGFFKEQFPLLRVYTGAFDQLMADVVPDLRWHLASQSVEAEMFLQQWFLSLFINCLPLPAVLVIWDTVVYEGLPVLLKVALARLLTMRSLLLSASFEDAMYLLRPKLGDQDQEEAAAQVGHLLLKQSDAIRVPWRVQRQLHHDSLAIGPLESCLSIDCCGAGLRLLAYPHRSSRQGPKRPPCCSSGVWLLLRTWFAGGWLRHRRLMYHTD